jgi:hypothetical protein
MLLVSFRSTFGAHSTPGDYQRQPGAITRRGRNKQLACHRLPAANCVTASRCEVGGEGRGQVTYLFRDSSQGPSIRAGNAPHFFRPRAAFQREASREGNSWSGRRHVQMMEIKVAEVVDEGEEGRVLRMLVRLLYVF